MVVRLARHGAVDRRALARDRSLGGRRVGVRVVCDLDGRVRRVGGLGVRVVVVQTTGRRGAEVLYHKSGKVRNVQPARRVQRRPSHLGLAAGLGVLRRCGGRVGDGRRVSRGRREREGEESEEGEASHV